MSKPVAPSGLSKKALKVWRETCASYELRADEARILEDACREIDLVERLDAELASGDLIVRGSQGQPVANPLVTEIRQHRAAVQRLLGSLRLPDEDASAAGRSSAAGRDLVNARWRRAG